MVLEVKQTTADTRASLTHPGVWLLTWVRPPMMPWMLVAQERLS